MKLKYFICVFLLSAILVAADHKNQGSNDKLPFSESYSGLVYKDTLTMATGTDDYHTRAFFIGDANLNDATIAITVTDESGTEDINALIYYSYDRKTWIAAPVDNNTLDAITTGTVSDTLGLINGADDRLFHAMPWMKIEFDGQTGNPNDTHVTFAIALSKEAVYWHEQKAGREAKSLE